MEVSKATGGFRCSCKNSRGRALGLMRNPTGNFASGGTPQLPSGRSSADYISLVARGPFTTSSPPYKQQLSALYRKNVKW